MNSKFYLLIFFIFCRIISVSAYTSPGTSQKLTLDNLVALSGGEVTFSGDFYSVNANVIVSATDTLSITSNAVVKFASATSFTINGIIIINPPVGVLFTAQNIANGYNGVALSLSNNSFIKKLTLEYAVSFKLSDSSPILDSCIFQFNNNSASTTFGSSALSLFRSNATIRNCKFLNNQRAAIQGGSNINNAPKILNCLFQGNNTSNANVPQINLGSTSTGSDTVKIIGNQILEASTNSGGIGFLPTGNVYAIISGNIIRKNRYGITFNGGSNINARVLYNVIDSNRTQNDPLLGGSGISFSGGSATSHQNVIVTGNLFRWNLWGITIGSTTTGGGAMPNLGNLTNTDTSDNGKNQFINNNNNSSTPQIDLYNNNVDDIFAQGNYWGTNDPNEVEAKIFHKPDNASLGQVNYSSFIVPIELISFTGTINNGLILLSWKTATEINSDHFEIERSADGQSFFYMGKVNASGNSNIAKEYYSFDSYTSKNARVFYRLKLVDKDGRFKYSNTISIKNDNFLKSKVSVYPNNFHTGDILHGEIYSDIKQVLKLEWILPDGKLISKEFISVDKGENKFNVQTPNISSGMIFLKFTGINLQQSIQLQKK